MSEQAVGNGTGEGRLRPCPGCGLADRVAGVPAVHLRGRGSVLRVTGGGEDQRIQTADSALATALAPEPPASPAVAGFGCLGLVTLLATVVLVAIGTTAGFDRGPVLNGEDGRFFLLPWIACGTGAAALLFLGLSAGKRRERTRIRAGLPAAERVWARGWYCGRCGTVHFPDLDGAEGGPLQVAEFRHRVWSAGGYGHLAGRRG